jgi:flagellar biosynthesis protein FlhF
MQVKRFVAADMRRALELVRQELGPEAIILSSSRTSEGVELLTTMGSDNELMALQRQPLGKMALASASPMISDGAWSDAGVIERSAKSAAQKHAQFAQTSFATTPSNNSSLVPGSKNLGKSGKELVNNIEQARLRQLAENNVEESAKEFLVGKQPRVNAAISRHAPVDKKKPISLKMTAAERYPLIEKESEIAVKSGSRSEFTAHSDQLEELQADIADMRFLLEQQLDRLIGSPKAGTPVMGSVTRRLERLGLPADVISKVTGRCVKVSNLRDAWPDALANFAHQLPVNGRDIVDQGGVFAFVGPTGVGKTTTIGKLAARYVLKHGADKVALITTDTYRIAAHDQLRSIARILRVPVRVVDESNSLESLLRSLRHCSLVLIDTAGFRHGDPHLKAQLAALAELAQIKSYLVLACNSQEQMLKASVHAYGAARLQGCVLTKLDETASMGEALGVIMQNRLPIVYTTDGQDIPKNIEVARAHQLVAKTVALLKKNPTSAVS